MATANKLISVDYEVFGKVQGVICTKNFFINYFL